MPKTQKKRGGRAANFTQKLVEGRSPNEAELIARIGNEAVTAGAEISREFRVAESIFRALPTPANKQKAFRARKRLLAVNLKGDAKLLSEIAAFAGGVERLEKHGPVNREFALAASFVYFCQSAENLPEDLLNELLKIVTLKAAWPRRPFTPTVQEIIDHLAVNAASDEESPDYKTVERWARILGIQSGKKLRRA